MTDLHVILGTGAVGTALAHDLTARGLRVRSVNRSGSRAGLPEGVEVLAGDLLDPTFADAAVAGAAVAYQVTQPAYTRWHAEFPALQAAVLGAAERAGTAVVLADNLYAYGDGGGQPITHRTPENPRSRKGELRKRMASDALALHHEGRVRVALTRPADYVGGTYALFRQMVVEPAMAGKPAQILGRADQPHSYSYVPDAARAMADVGTSPDAWGRAWITPTMEPITQRELIQRLWEAGGNAGQAKIRALRGVGARIVGTFVPMLGESVEMLYEWEAPYVVRAEAFEAAFGWSATGWDEAIGAMTGAAVTR